MTRARLMLLSMFCLAMAPSMMVAQGERDPEKNFEFLWNTYDRNYALFRAKHIDWHALYKIYRPRVIAQTTDDGLFTVMADMLGNLNDNHIRLQSPGRRFRSGILGQMKMEDFSLDLILTRYVRGKVEASVGDVFHYGWLIDSIGYFHFRGFGRMAETVAAVDEIVGVFRHARGIIIDVRSNGGGNDRVGKAIADRFADRKRLYMKTMIRNGPRYDDFTPPKYWYVEPRGPIQFTGPVVLLTHRFSVSAAENFALAMRTLPHVTTVGDATSGVFADVYGTRLPNGWEFSVPYKLFVDPTGFCWEGIGVPADIRETNAKEDIANGTDRVLELAMAMITKGCPTPQVETASLEDIRESLARVLTRTIEKKGIDAAIMAFEAARRGDPSGYYLDEEEFSEVGNSLLDASRLKEALAVFKVGVQEFPWSWRAHQNLAGAYMDSGVTNEAQANYKKAADLNRRSYPWEISAAESDVRAARGVKFLARILAKTLHEQGFEAARVAFEKGKAGGPDTYYIDENEINLLGYRLMGAGKMREAIEVFKLNVSEFPKSWNVYDSLGEAYMTNGDKELAIKHYEKSIELNPANTNGIAILKSLRGQ